MERIRDPLNALHCASRLTEIPEIKRTCFGVSLPSQCSLRQNKGTGNTRTKSRTRSALYSCRRLLKISVMTDSVHLNFDGAWPDQPGIPMRDLLNWGPRLRYFAAPAVIEAFYYEVIKPLPPFALYGSGDFHHIAALLVRRFEAPLTIV